VTAGLLLAAGVSVLSKDPAISAMLLFAGMASSLMVIEMRAGQVTLFPALCGLAFYYGGTVPGVVTSAALISTGLYFHWRNRQTRLLFFSYIPVALLFTAALKHTDTGTGVLVPAGILLQLAFHAAIHKNSVNLAGMITATWIINGILAHLLLFFIKQDGTAGCAVILTIVLVSLVYDYQFRNRLYLFTDRIKTLSLQNRLVSFLYTPDDSFMLFLMNGTQVWTMQGKPACVPIPEIPSKIFSIEKHGKWMAVSTESSVFIAEGTAALELESLGKAELEETLALLENVWKASFSKRRLENAFLGAAMMFVQLADRKDSDTHSHSVRVSRLSVKLAQILGLSHSSVLQLQLGALLHDIGKLAVPGRLIMKKGLLTKSERNTIETHPESGAKLLGAMQKYDEASAIVLQHHEHIDGSGYPRGISGSSISLFARIVAVADVFDAVTSPRAYHSGKTDQDALAEIEKYRGKHFDANVVDALKEMLNES